MLAALLIWIYIGFILLAYGHGTFLLLRRVFHLEDSADISWPVLALLGLCALNVLTPFLSLFIRLGLEANILILGGALLFTRSAWIFIRPQINFQFSWSYFMMAGIAFLLILENATHVPANPDTNLYHAQMIRWIETYRAVPGLGNLHTRLAFNSNWLVLNAFFSLSFLGWGSFHLLPGVFFVFAGSYFFSGFIELGRGNVSSSAIIKAVLLPVSLHIWASEISSPGTDLPSSILIWVALSLWLESIEKQKQETFQTIAFIFSITAITFKVSTFPLLLLPAALGIKSLIGKDFKFASSMVLASILCWLPWLARNFITSGYWVYPLPALIPLSPPVDWRIPPATVVHELDGIRLWARQFTLKPDVAASHFWDWFPFWLSRQTPTQRILLWTSLLLPPSFGLYSIFKRHSFNVVYVTTYAGILFWLFGAPAIRFGYGFLVMMNLSIFAPLLLATVKWISLQRIDGAVRLFQLAVILYLGFMLYRSVDLTTLGTRVIMPESYRVFPTISCNIANATLQCPKRYNQCGYDAFPCTVKAFPYVEMRGDNWQDGFRISQP